jgi:hypothetical protein
MSLPVPNSLTSIFELRFKPRAVAVTGKFVYVISTILLLVKMSINIFKTLPS